MAVYIALGILIGLIVGVVGLFMVLVLVSRHQQKKRKNMIETFFRGLQESLEKGDDGK